ncbi:G-D-S-L family lipolytic protein [Xanthomarina sp. GH4-25]|uniref:G-D-S-L family lipolytic protein n=1 Tax=Xanthomarina sp. GH4-25 TaxID=3349335 RepID=UPI000D67B55D|nr:G-D-S-L family lipolytic protein [Flavobacteriaceae bacterium LYZ1037]
MKTKYIWLLAVLLGFTACNNDDDSSSSMNDNLPPLVAGEADFSNYVAVGASFSAGFTDNALFIASQENSFPNLLSMKFDMLGGGNFSQPLMSDNIGGLLFNGMQMPDGSFAQRLYFDLSTSSPTPLQDTPTTEATTVLSGSFNNIGVPGAKSFHLGVEGYGFANPYFGRMASNPMASMMGDAVAQSPTFFTLSEIGGNDVLSYATSGGSGVDQTGNFNPATYGNNDITDPMVFAGAFNAAVDALILNGAKGVVTNVPYITSLPHFTRVPYNPIPLGAGTAQQLNIGYATYNGGLQFALANGLITADEAAARTIVFEESETNAMVLIDEDLTDLTVYGIPSYRQSTSDDLFVLTLSTLIPQGYGTQIPLEDKWALTPQEQLAIRNATDAYNVTIESVASTKGLALVDFKSILIEASTSGIDSGDFTLTTDLVTGGLVSLDGIHLTSRGYAVMANEMMRAIDATYGSNFEASGNFYDCGNYPTNYGKNFR